MNANLNINIDGNFISKIITSIKMFFVNNFYKVNIKELTENEENVIKKFYNNTLNEYTLDSVSLKEDDFSYPIILKLVKRNILKGLNVYEKIDNYDGTGVKYTLTNKAWKKLNKRKNKQ